MATDGTNYVLQIKYGNAWKTIGCGTSNGFTGTTGVIDGSSKCSGRYEDKQPGRIGWTMEFAGKAAPVDDADASLASFNQLSAFQKSGTIFQIRQVNLQHPEDIIRGDAFITSLSKTSPDNEAVTFDASFQGRGEYFTTPEV